MASHVELHHNHTHGGPILVKITKRFHDDVAYIFPEFILIKDGQIATNSCKGADAWIADASVTGNSETLQVKLWGKLFQIPLKHAGFGVIEADPKHSIIVEVSH